MKKSPKIMYKSLWLMLFLVSFEALCQQKKTFTESFNVDDNAVLDINTSYTDIEFETWNKNQVMVEATIIIDGATKEEAEHYFENEGISITGNSKKVIVTSNNENSWNFHHLENLHIEIPELPEIPEFDFNFDFDFSDLEDLPPMPPAPNPNFDYQAFKKDGEKYLKEWQKNFEKNFGEPYQIKMEEWQRKMEAKRMEMQEQRQKIHEKRQEAHQERTEKLAEARVERAQERVEAHQKRMQDHQARMAQRAAMRYSIKNGDSTKGRSNMFYFNSEGANKNFEVKKTIKIKMPKSAKIKMNVRYGEVKLAENTNNMDAALSHASLWASTIDGNQTTVMASYSPVSVEKWNYGQLQVDYSENIDLKEVLNLRLNATSSDVTIDNLSKTASIQNSFGPLYINSISEDFKSLEIALQNAELVCHLPKSPFKIYVVETDSEFNPPAKLQLTSVDSGGSIVHNGYLTQKNTDKSIVIDSKYSEVFLE